jgi:hypothetical protein
MPRILNDDPSGGAARSSDGDGTRDRASLRDSRVACDVAARSAACGAACMRGADVAWRRSVQRGAAKCSAVRRGGGGWLLVICPTIALILNVCQLLLPGLVVPAGCHSISLIPTGIP